MHHVLLLLPLLLLACEAPQELQAQRNLQRADKYERKFPTLARNAQTTHRSTEVSKRTIPTSKPASEADKAVQHFCSFIIYDIGDVTEAMTQAVYGSDPDTLTRYPEISAEVIHYVRHFVDNDLPATPDNALKLHALCRTWGDAEFERVFNQKP